jgi:hypothetical protein
MSDVREKLKPLVGKRIKVRGGLVNFGAWTRNYRDVGRACISYPEINGEVLAEHVWVTEVPHWLKYKCSVGEQVEFSAVVIRYSDKNGTTNYCLTNADELCFLTTPPALPIPDPPVDEMPEPEQNDDPPPEPIGDEPLGDPLEMMRQAKHFAKVCGSLEQAERIAEAVQRVTAPLPELIAWIKALREE